MARPNSEAERRLDELIAEGDGMVEASEKPGAYDRLYVSATQFSTWRLSCANALEQLFGEDSDLLKAFRDPLEYPTLRLGVTEDHIGRRTNLLLLKSMVGVMKASKAKVGDDRIFSRHNQLLAGVYRSMTDAAESLLEAGYEDAAAIYCRVALEVELGQRVTRAGISIPTKKKPSLGDFNEALYRTGALKKHEWRAILRWADIGNAAAHGSFDEYTQKDVRDMLTWTSDFVAMGSTTE